MSDERRDDEREGQREEERENGRGDDPVDALLSAGMDDALSAEEWAERDGLLGQDAVASRAAAFEDVDAALRSLAEEQAGEPGEAARIAASLEVLRERLDWPEEGPAAPEATELRQVTKRDWLRPAAYFGSGLAVAAAAMLFLTVGAGDETRSPREVDEERNGLAAAIVEGAGDAGSEEESMVTALGYAEWAGDLSELGLASPEDLEIVEQLELLDFLAARETEGRG